MKKLIIISLVLFSFAIAVNAQDQTVQEPIMFNYGQIPFGKSIDEVLTLLQGAIVTGGDDVSIDTIGEYEGLLEYFAGGIYSRWGFESYLNSKLVKKYSVTYEAWANIKWINIYFFKEFGVDSGYVLFLVKKVLKAPAGSYENVFKGMKTTITKTVKIEPKVFQVKYQSFVLKASYSYEPAYMGIWKTKYSKVFLLVHNDLWTSGDPELLYVDNKGWDKYLRSCNAYALEKKRKEEEEGKGVGESF